MVRSEAVELLKSIKEKYIHGGDEGFDEKRKQAIDIAVCVLEQKPMTNADRIREMSDDELAEWIARTQIGAIKDALNLLRLPYDEPDGLVEMGKTEALEWLKQPKNKEPPYTPADQALIDIVELALDWGLPVPEEDLAVYRKLTEQRLKND